MFAYLQMCRAAAPAGFILLPSTQRLCASVGDGADRTVLAG